MSNNQDNKEQGNQEQNPQKSQTQPDEEASASFSLSSSSSSISETTSETEPNTTSKVIFSNLIDVKDTPTDQLKPHRMQKGRLSPCYMRKRWVMAKIYKMGGHIRDRKTKSLIEIKPGTKLPEGDNKSKPQDDDYLFYSE
ncbi:hypothetical protein T4B_10504 [Trichinella pseudospiralis]|uniref:Uncharacterized protein n=1 Tax=Trichinella pseudospiralis TaxID=6337 RepID=A0A0V1EVF1_TRIPS|nr:hypothetical protein T4A_2262 [Trichinella pseudospiralis]KRZ32733.1 hypothetical protein T4B_10504 [Trichinella pseudospiralis]